MKYISILFTLLLFTLMSGCDPSDNSGTETSQPDSAFESENSDKEASENKEDYTKVLKSKSGNSKSVLKLNGPDSQGELSFYISVTAGKCTGEIKGIATKAKNSNSKYLYKESKCRLEIKLKNEQAEVTQYGCKKYVGMFCGFSGTYKR